MAICGIYVRFQGGRRLSRTPPVDLTRKTPKAHPDSSSAFTAMLLPSHVQVEVVDVFPTETLRGVGFDDVLSELL